jgi:hypothetical protein
MDHAKTFVELAMSKKLFAWAAGVCALMLTSGVYQPADAKHAGQSGTSKSSVSMGHSYRLGAPYAKSAYAKPAYAKSTHAFKHKHAFRHHKRIIVVGYNDYAYGSECYWLRRKALYSGSAYWWNRYYTCVEGY